LTEIEWKAGDRVVHQGKPEWGVGSVTAAQGAVQDGRHCQRVTVRFENGGLKTVSTAFARLAKAESGSGAAENPNGTWLDDLEGVDVRDQLTTLPDAASDPFSSLEARLKSTLELYRFSDSGGSLLAWASAQTGLSDPLSRLNRHELELAFQKFQMLLDRHLGELTTLARRSGVQIDTIVAAASPEARRALQRANRRR
jgi:Protein of unknown function (DUF3553)